MRPGSLAVVAVVCALLGASTTLIVAKASGWVGAESATRTVVLTTSGAATPADNPIDENAEAKPLAGNDFDPAQIYRERAAGVVTLIALFGPNDASRPPTRRRAPASSSPPTATSSRTRT